MNEDLVSIDSCYYCGKACKRGSYNVRDRLGVSNIVWSFNKCDGCGSLILSPRPHEKDLRDYYPEVYCFEPDNMSRSFFRNIISQCEYRLFYKHIYHYQATRVLKLLPNKSAQIRLIDFGCGEGLLLRALKKSGLTVEGAELKQRVVEGIKSVLNINCHTINFDREGYGLPLGSYDVVILSHVLEHMAEPQRAIQELSNLLKGNGKLVIAVPVANSTMIKYLGKYAVVLTEAPRHVSIPSKEGLLRLLNDCGFSISGEYPDSALNCAAHYGLSFFPCSATSPSSNLSSILSRVLGLFCTLLALPWVWVENYVLRKPIIEIFICSKKN